MGENVRLYYSSLHLAMFSIVIFIHYSMIGLSLFYRSVTWFLESSAVMPRFRVFFEERKEDDYYYYFLLFFRCEIRICGLILHARA